MRLWAQITVTVAVNLAAVGGLMTAVVMQQTRSGLASFLYAPARERVRELGREVEEEFPEMTPAERTDWLRTRQAVHGVTLAVFDDTGRLVAGPVLEVPAGVGREIRRGRQRSPDEPPRAGRRRGRENPPIFMVKEGGSHWIGYHFPVVMVPGQPPVRHTLTVVAPSLLTTPFLFDWTPWAAGSALALLVTALCWIPLIRRFSRSLHAVQAGSADIAKGRFDVRIPVRGKDEFADLAASVRRMAEQLSQLIHGQHRFLADVAHELCAPLSRIQLSTGILTQNSGRGTPPTAVERLERDVAHMSALVGDLLSFTKGAVHPPDLEPLPLDAIARQATAQEGAPGALVTVDVPPDLWVLADRDFLLRAIANVVRNAIRYAGDAGPVAVSAHASGSKVILSVEDRGPGLPETALEEVFQPFFRPDGARTHGTGGAGLGLAIVKSCVEACGGKVSCRNRKPAGLEVTMELARAEAGMAPGSGSADKKWR